MTVREFLRWASLVATLALTSHSEWTVGTSLDLGPWLSCLIPVAIDCYVMFSLLSGRDQPWALGLLWSSVVIGSVHSSGSHPTTALFWGLDTKVLLGIGLGTALTLVLWRVDLLFHEELQAKAEAEEIARRERDEALRHEREVQAEAARQAALALAAPVPVQPPAPAPEVRKAPVTKKPVAKKQAPTREEARAILLALDSLDAKSNGQLAREHGGTDVYWSGRKKDLRVELAEMSGEVAKL